MNQLDSPTAAITIIIDTSVPAAALRTFNPQPKLELIYRPRKG